MSHLSLCICSNDPVVPDQWNPLLPLLISPLTLYGGQKGTITQPKCSCIYQCGHTVHSICSVCVCACKERA